MMKKEYSFLSNDGITMIHAAEYMPETDHIKGMIRISHGCSEESGLYEHLAERMCRNGWITGIHDHIGHGKSLAEGHKRNHFGPEGSWQYAADDLIDLAKRDKEKHGDLPYVMIGHSMGAFLLRCALIQSPGLCDGAVISGSAYQSKANCAAGKLLIEREIRKNGYESDSDFVQMLLHDSNNRKLKKAGMEGNWLLKDPESLRMFEEDSIAGGRITAGIFRELIRGIEFSNDKKEIRKMDRNMPLLLIAGSEDVTVTFGKDIDKLEKLYCSAGIVNVRKIIMTGWRHCILFDGCADECTRMIQDWIEKEVLKK